MARKRYSICSSTWLTCGPCENFDKMFSEYLRVFSIDSSPGFIWYFDWWYFNLRLLEFFYDSPNNMVWSIESVVCSNDVVLALATLLCSVLFMFYVSLYLLFQELCHILRVLCFSFTNFVMCKGTTLYYIL